MNQDRYEALRSIGCIACRIEGQTDCGPVEIHHLNLGGYAGQKRRGDDYTIPLGKWHHRGVSHWNLHSSVMEQHFGPSLARQSSEFRQRYGTDDELLERVNRMVGVAA